MDNRDTILHEMSRVILKLKNNGINTDNFFYGYRETDTKDDNKITWEPENSFLKVFPESLIQMSTKLNGTEAMVIVALMPFISYESGRLKKHNQDSMKIKDISLLTGLHENTVSRLMISLVNKQVFYRGKTGEGHTHEFYANPYIFFKGKYINKTLIDMFKDYKK